MAIHYLQQKVSSPPLEKERITQYGVHCFRHPSAPPPLPTTELLGRSVGDKSSLELFLGASQADYILEAVASAKKRDDKIENNIE